MSFTYERNWSFSFNNLYTPTSNTDDPQYALWAIKAMLLGQLGGLSSGLWTTYYSCNGVTAGTPGDGVDRWGSTYTPANILSGTVAHSWYVLKSPLMNGKTFYLLISYNQSSNLNAKFAMSAVAPTGGTATSDPILSQSWNFSASGYTALPSFATTQLLRFNLCLASDGSAIIFSKASTSATINPQEPEFGFMVIAPVGCNPLDNYPIFTFALTNTSNTGGLASTQLLSNDYNPALLYNGTSAYIGILGSQYVDSNAVTYSLDGLTNQLWIDTPWMIVSNSTGWHTRGRLPDIGILPVNSSSSLGPGWAAHDVNGNVTFITVGCLLIPANSVPILM